MFLLSILCLFGFCLTAQVNPGQRTAQPAKSKVYLLHTDVLKKSKSNPNPDAQILYTYGLVRAGWSEDIQAVIAELQQEGDSKLHYLQLESCQKWELNLNHTVEKAYESRGEAIIEKIKEITGW